MPRNDPVGPARGMALSLRQCSAASMTGTGDEDDLSPNINVGDSSMSEMRARAFASTLDSIAHLGHLTDKAFGCRKGRFMSETDQHALEDELELLLNQSETLHCELSSRFMRQRQLASLSLVEEDEPGSMLLPLQAIARKAVEEIQGLRPVGYSGVQSRGEEPILVPERDTRDDVLAAKSIALLNATASVLHGAIRTLECSRALCAGSYTWLQNESLAASSVECVAKTIEADLNAVARKYPMLAAPKEDCASAKSRHTCAELQPAPSGRLASSAHIKAISGEEGEGVAVVGAGAGAASFPSGRRCRAQHDERKAEHQWAGAALACGAAGAHETDSSDHHAPRRNNMAASCLLERASVKSLRGGGAQMAGKIVRWTKDMQWQVGTEAGHEGCPRTGLRREAREAQTQPHAAAAAATAAGVGPLRMCGGQQVENVDASDHGTDDEFGIR